MQMRGRRWKEEPEGVPWGGKLVRGAKEEREKMIREKRKTQRSLAAA